LKSKISFNIFYELFSQILVWLTFLIDQSNYHENLSDQKSVQSLVCIGKRLKNNANTFVFIFSLHLYAWISWVSEHSSFINI
jgi:hypothetical protein